MDAQSVRTDCLSSKTKDNKAYFLLEFCALRLRKVLLTMTTGNAVKEKYYADITGTSQDTYDDKAIYEAVKRLFDVVVSVLLLVILIVPMIILDVIIKLDSPGAGIYTQERLGRYGIPFTLYKFRSMHLNAEVSGPQWAQENDCRCTKFGRFIRKRHLDELPQLINVIKGEMSLVGPRPEREFFYNEFSEYINGFSKRLAVTPGITGWAQVNGGYRLTPEEKLHYDLEYINKRSFSFDIKCIIRTVKVMFTHDGAF